MTRFLLLVSCALPLAVRAVEPASPLDERAAIERVYHSHRTSTRQTFEEAMPRALLEKIVRQDQHKAAVLSSHYGMEITPAMLAAEVERINTTTRAPEVLTEIKHALGDDAARFAAAMARPLVVERVLRARFENDANLHAAQRTQADAAREALLAKKPASGMTDATWQLTPRPADDQPAAPVIPATPTKARGKSATYTNEATARIAQPLTPPVSAAPGKEKMYLEDLDPQLQQILGTQLQKPGDVSAVIETPGGFLVFQAKERTAVTLSASSLTIPKRSYEAWLAAQP